MDLIVTRMPLGFKRKIDLGRGEFLMGGRLAEFLALTAVLLRRSSTIPELFFFPLWFGLT
jgi:hypothetical protein